MSTSDDRRGGLIRFRPEREPSAMKTATAAPFDDDSEDRDERAVIDESGEVVELDTARTRRTGATSTSPADLDTHDLVDDEDRPVVPVDPADNTGPSDLSLRERLDAKTAARREVIAPWLKDTAELRYAARWVLDHTKHHAKYHAARAPKYAGRVAARAPIGAAKVAGHTIRWLGDAEGRPLRHGAVTVDDPETYMKLCKQRSERMRWRWIVFGLMCTAALLAVGALLVLTPGWAHWLSVVAVLSGLALIGSSADRPILDRGIDAEEQAPKLTADIVTRALGSLGIAGINQTLAKDPAGIKFPAPIVRDGPGWRATIDLPYGVTVTDIIDRRDRLASGLRRPLGCVWPESAGSDDAHEGRLILWVGDRPMAKSKQPTWPLAKTGTTDVFLPQPFGTDQRGRWVDLTLAYTSGVTGSVPRMGKTFAQREFALIAGLDPRVELHLFDLKGTGDLGSLECIAHRYRSGDDEDDIEYAVADMRAVRAELRRRAKVVRELPRDICPENKVTSELASRRGLGLHPIFVDVDECQVWFEHPTYGRELEDICTDIVKRGPALAIMIYLATQRPDAKSLPPGISANAVTRLCLKVRGQVENDMVLGTSAYKMGLRATMLAFSDKGIAYLQGEGAEAQIVRTVAGLDAVASERIARRARAERITAGRLTGYAAGEVDQAATNAASLLDDVAGVFGTDDKVWSEVIVARLGELRPDTYRGWTPAQLAAALKPYGIGTAQVWGQLDGGRGANRRGITTADVREAIAARDGKQLPPAGGNRDDRLAPAAARPSGPASARNAR